MSGTDYQLRTDRYLQLLERYQNVIFWLCYRYAHYRQDCTLDYLQDVRERIWRSLDKLRPGMSEGEECQWVRLQAQSVLSNHLRKHKPPTVSLDKVGDMPDPDNTDAMFMLLDDLLSLLPADEGRLLRDLCQGITAEEIARDRHLSLHTVQNQISIARRHLRQINEQYNNPDTQ